MNSPTGYDVIYSLLHLSFKEAEYRLQFINEKLSIIFWLLRSKEQHLVRYFYHEYWSSKYVNWFYGSMLLLSPLCESGNDGIPSGEAHTLNVRTKRRESSLIIHHGPPPPSQTIFLPKISLFCCIRNIILVQTFCDKYFTWRHIKIL